MFNAGILIIFILSGGMAAIGNVLLKSGMNQVGGFNLNFLTNWQIIVGFILYGLSSVLYLKLLSTLEVTKVYPLLVAYMFIVLLLLGTLVLKESITWAKVLGTLVIIGGIFLVSR